MQSTPSCSVWKHFTDMLTEPLSATHTCPKADANRRRQFKPAVLKYFADCCMPDGGALAPRYSLARRSLG